ncbi:MAG TPA: ABC transporter ATP-binding protein [Allosphingosinicella sp.]
MPPADPPTPSSTLSLFGTFMALLGTMSSRRRRHLAGAAAALAIGAFAELMTIGAVLPFLALVADPARAAELPGFSLFLALTGAEPGDDLLSRAAILLIAATLAAAGARVLILWMIQRFIIAFSHDIGTAIFGRMLRQPYSYYVTRNPSELLASIEKVHIITFATLLPLLSAISSTLMAAAIVALLLWIDPFTAAIAAIAVGLLYMGVSIVTRPRLRANSQILSQTGTARIQAIQEGLGGIRDILLGNSQHVFEENFRRLDLRYRRAHALNLFMSGAPRFIIEAAGVVVLILLALTLSLRPGGIVAAIPVLGALALGAQRLLPLIQQSYVGWSSFAGSAGMVADVIALMQAPVLTVPAPGSRERPEPFATDIVFDNVSLHYPDRTPALRGIDLRIGKGERIGLVGTTGSGKSSLLDLLMALIEPSEGEIRIDGTRLDDRTRAKWQAQIAHVPQSLYLADGSIASNIAFAEPEAEIDRARVEEAARLAQLHEFIAALPQGYATEVGERGVRLSGGQRQRIGIARALYKQAGVLIFDEATGALDRKTEKAIMAEVAALGRDITMIVVAHRISALTLCDRIVRLEGGRIVDSGGHEELVGEAG